MIPKRASLKLVCAVAATAVCALAAPAILVAWAHPADMYFHTQTIHLAPAGISLAWSIYPGPLLVPSVWDEADRDLNQVVSDAEARAWVELHLGELPATLDDTTPLAWRLESVAWPTSFTGFQLGDETILVHLSAGWPPGIAGVHRLDLHNLYEEAISVNWFTLHGDEGITFHTPDQEKGLLQVDFVMPGAGAPAPSEDALRTHWDSGTPDMLPLPGTDAPVPAEGDPQSPQDLRPVTILTGLVRIRDLSPIFYPVALTIALALGAIHALTPGHGKALVAAYLVGSRGTTRHAAALGVIVTLTHTGSVLALGALTLVASRFLLPTTLLPLLEVASGLLIAAMGATLLRRRWRGYRAVTKAKQRPPRRLQLNPQPGGSAGGGRVIAVNKAIPVEGALPAVEDVDALSMGKVSWRTLVGLGVSGGLVPCPDAIAILLVAIAINRVALGLVLIEAFSFGLALVLIAIGMAMVRGRRLLERLDTFGRLAPAMPLVSAAVVMGLGALLTLGAVSGAGLFSTSKPSPAEQPAASAPGPASDTFHLDRASVLHMALDAESRHQLYVFSLGAGESFPLTDEPLGAWDYALSPDWTTVVYTSMREEGGGDLWAINTDGANRRMLLACPGATCTGAAWSPDGERIVYEKHVFTSADAPLGLPSLWWLDPSTGETAPVFQDSQLPGMNASWSPDGRWLSYVPLGSAKVEVYNLADGRSRSIPTRMGGPVVWDPAGDALLVADIRGEGEQAFTHLLRFDLETEQTADLTGEGTLEDAWAAWSPDGEWIALVRRDLGSAEASLGTRIWLMCPDGSQEHPLTEGHDVHHGRPVWSPDGKYLLLPWYPLNVAMADPAIWLLDIETRNLLELVTPGIRPAWLP